MVHLCAVTMMTMHIMLSDSFEYLLIKNRTITTIGNRSNNKNNNSKHKDSQVNESDVKTPPVVARIANTSFQFKDTNVNDSKLNSNDVDVVFIFFVFCFCLLLSFVFSFVYCCPRMVLQFINFLLSIMYFYFAHLFIQAR